MRQTRGDVPVMNEFYEKAIERLRDDKGLSGNKERAMAPAVREALEKFCEEDGEFAQAVAQGGSFPECMKAVAKGVGGSISDIEAYRKAVQFYFPGAEIETTMHVRLCGDDAKPEGLLLKLDDFFGV